MTVFRRAKIKLKAKAAEKKLMASAATKARDESDIPAPSDDEVYRKGQVVYALNGLPPPAIEGFLIRIRRETGARVDWHFVGGIAQIKVLGTRKDRNAVREALSALEHLYLRPTPMEGADEEARG
jgi:hypothetical protein